MGRLAVIGGLVATPIGVGSLALTLYLWFGEWPSSAKQGVDRSKRRAAESSR